MAEQMPEHEKHDLANDIVGKEGHKAKKHGGKLDSMEIRGAHGGGFVIDHRPRPPKGKDGLPSYAATQTHVAPDHDALIAHVGEHASRLQSAETDNEDSDGDGY